MLRHDLSRRHTVLLAAQMAITMAGWLAVAQAAPEVARAPEPAWVTPLPLPVRDASSSAEAPGGVRYLLVDSQRNQAEQTTFQHRAIEMVTPAGVQENSRITINFIPEYQTLTLHALSLHRDGQNLNRLATAKIRVIEREDGMDDHVYTGAVTATIDVEDVRPGDILEYSSSLKGENPVFAGVLSEFVPTAWPVPVARFQYRLLCPKDLPFQVYVKNAEIHHEELTTASFKEDRWSRTDLSAVAIESGTPTWYIPADWIQLSSYANWADVVQWALQFYGQEEPLPPTIREKVEELRSLPGTDQRILGALEYVQTKLRYLSAAEGVHSHRPYPVAEVVARGYGDCKDKARLLSSMLRAMGIDANPALVATSSRHQIADWLPTPEAFDHVIVAVQLPNGPIWVDPTNDFQRGPLHQRFLPPYGKALLIRPGETALRDLQPAGWKETAVENEAQFFLSDLSESARLSLVTTRTGEQADGHRALLALIDRTEIAKSRLNEMARWFPGAVATYAPQYADDEPNNRLVRREEYEIPHFWETWQDDPGHFNADVLPFIIYDCVRKPDTTVRTSPLGVPYPLRIHERYTVHFAAPGDFQNAEWSLDDSAFRYRCAVHGQGKDLTIDHWFETLADFVPPERMPSYLENLRKVREGSVYGIRVPKDNAPAPDPSSRLSASPAPSSPSGVAHLMVPFVALCTLFIALFAAVLYLLWRPEWRMYPDDTYHGLGGWLVVVAIGLVFGPLAQLAAAGYNVQFLDENTWRQMTAPGGSLYHPLWAGIILVEVAYNVGMLVASVVLLILFFRKRRTFPLLYMIVLVLSAFFTSADTVAVHFVCLEVPNFPKPAPNHAGAAMLRAFIWIPYMLMSKRVRSTFIRGGPRRHH